MVESSDTTKKTAIGLFSGVRGKIFRGDVKTLNDNIFFAPHAKIAAQLHISIPDLEKGIESISAYKDNSIILSKTFIKFSISEQLFFFFLICRPANNSLKRFNNYKHIEKQRRVFNVVQIVLQSFDVILKSLLAAAIIMINLGPAR